ncbi:MAG: preprotein translocase subunit YajC [Puniceicoccales bacterium]|jgi:preprotein translocase subunit YajC|nr:preprotein translocase subunit YajC [Puniceicoccales bacterium]
MSFSLSPVFADAAAVPAASAPAAPAPAAPAAPVAVPAPVAAPGAVQSEVVSQKTVASPAPRQNDFADSVIGILPFVLIVVAFYFLLIRPQRQREKEIRKRQSELKTGDNVLTTAGIYGKVVTISGEKVTLQIGEGVRVVFQRQAIVGFSTSEGQDEKSEKK